MAGDVESSGSSSGRCVRTFAIEKTKERCKMDLEAIKGIGGGAWNWLSGLDLKEVGFWASVAWMMVGAVLAKKKLGWEREVVFGLVRRAARRYGKGHLATILAAILDVAALVTGVSPTLAVVGGTREKGRKREPTKPLQRTLDREVILSDDGFISTIDGTLRIAAGGQVLAMIEPDGTITVPQGVSDAARLFWSAVEGMNPLAGKIGELEKMIEDRNVQIGSLIEQVRKSNVEHLRVDEDLASARRSLSSCEQALLNSRTQHERDVEALNRALQGALQNVHKPDGSKEPVKDVLARLKLAEERVEELRGERARLTKTLENVSASTPASLRMAALLRDVVVGEVGELLGEEWLGDAVTCLRDVGYREAFEEEDLVIDADDLILDDDDEHDLNRKWLRS